MATGLLGTRSYGLHVGARALRMDPPWLFVHLRLLGLPIPETWVAALPDLFSKGVSTSRIPSPDRVARFELIPAPVYSGRIESLLFRQLLRN